MTDATKSVPTTRLFLLLASRLDPADYAERHRRGAAPDRVPYGAENVPGEVELTVSAPTEATRVPTRLRNWLTRMFVADVAHGLRNRRAILTADAVYAHTEHEYLAAAFVLRLFGNRSVQLAGQTIWLFETLDGLPSWRRRVIDWLLRRVDVFVYNSTANAVAGRRLLPDARHAYLPFGVSAAFRGVDRAADTSRGEGERPLVLSVGIDRSRDWPTLGSALAGIDASVRVAARATIPELPDATVQPTRDFAELLDLYARATVVVIAVQPNLHASGITTVLEAAAAGVPVIATAVGGLEDYFRPDEVRFVSPGAPAELAAALRDLLDDNDGRARASTALRSAFDDRGYDTTGYWRRVTDLLAGHAPDNRYPG